MENLQRNFQETLTFVDRHVPPFDVSNLSTCAHLHGEVNDWDAILSRTASHTILRSEPLRLSAQRVYEAMALADASSWSTVFEHFRAQRQEWLGRIAGESHHPELNWRNELKRPGAFMIFQPEATLSDGAAYVASNGYLDFHNSPPWDTWVMTTPCPDGDGWRGLLCWVPDWAQELVEGGIAVNPENCIFWAQLQDGQVNWRTRDSLPPRYNLY